MRTPRRPRGSKRLGAVVLAAAALVAVGTVQGAGDPVRRAAAQAWSAVFGERAETAWEQRVVVVLAAPSLADRMAAEGEADAREQRRWTAEAEGAQRLLLAGLRQRGVTIRRDHVYTRTFNGFSALVDARALAEIERATGVAGVYPVRTVYPAAALRPDVGEGRSPAAHVALPGFDGNGVTIALLDSGVDRRHPYVRGRVQRGYDLVDGDRNVAPAAKPDEARTLEAHGTRMAGLLVGEGGPRGAGGVAPGAEVLPIRVLRWQETADGEYALLGRGDVLLAGLERAVDPDADGDVDDAADIVLAPVVEPYAAFADSPETRAVTGATNLGALVVAPAGNDGRPGPGFGSVGAPAAAEHTLAVGAVDGRRVVLQVDATLLVDSDAVHDGPLRALGAVGPEQARSLQVVTLAGATLAHPGGRAGASARGEELGDFFSPEGISLVAGRAVLLSGDANLPLAVGNAAAAGAAVVLVHGTDLPAGALDQDEDAAVPVLALSVEAADEALAGLAEGEAVSIALGAGAPAGNPALMDVAAFSSGGLAFDGRVKPDLVAPGVGLVTADTGGQGRYTTATGTSAASALVAGAAALVAQARPGLAPSELRSLLVGSAAQLARGDTPLPVTAQGAGHVDARRAAAAELAVEPATLAFGRAEGADWSQVRTLTVTNVSTRRLDVGFGIAPDAAGVPLAFSVAPARFAIEPGASAEVTVSVSADGELTTAAGGAVVVSADGAQPVRVPWAIARRVDDRAPLVGEVQLSHSEFAPSPAAPAVLAFRAGRVDAGPAGETIEPVGLLELELWTADGRRLGVLARLRDVLPGRYAFGLTGRGPSGKVLAEGRYVLRLRAYPVDGEDGTEPSTAEAVFTITR
ncbi:MAG TPA: S8 family serine peptidase [Gaiellaceae bacterium]|nr:S8 family serine peptidase [Gaiellaceae bacterium]